MSSNNKLNKRINIILLWLIATGCFQFITFNAKAQQNKHNEDSIAIKRTLSEVVVHVFEKDDPLQNQPGAVSYLSGEQLGRYNDVNIASAINAIPGVRMELRSPGSMRLNIRGSTLRSPFGVRNIKIYYNGVPLTDPGGNTYLNQLRFDDIGSIEIIRGPVGSMYGAGMGGVLLIRSDLMKENKLQNDYVQLQAGGGRFGLWQGSLTAGWGNAKSKNQLRYGELKKTGYRDHTNIKHRVASYETNLKINDKEKLNAFFHYSDLYYQTPGALTQEQFEKDPRAARPASESSPSSEENKAAVYQKAFLLGLKHTYKITNALQNTTALYGAYTDFTNPTVRNYELRKEPHFGGRTVFQYQHSGNKVQSQFWLGAEFQQGYFSQQDFQNKMGIADSLMSSHQVNAFTAFLFAQTEWHFPHGWGVNAGMSVNHSDLHFTKSFPEPAVSFNKKFHLVAAPRIALSKKINTNLLVYADWSKGFSPPTISELLPSTNRIDTKLQAEKGTQYEAGGKGYFFNRLLFYDVSMFYFQLDQSISLRRDSSDADYFVNAGKVNKKGLELALHYHVINNKNRFFTNVNVWSSLTLFDFKYKNYFSGDKDFSGNNMPGSPFCTAAAGVDLHTKPGITAHLTWQHTSGIPLDNANTVYSKTYDLLGLRMAYQQTLTKTIHLKLSAGGDNLLNEKYSLGDDINAFGGRYFNAAPPINFYLNIGIKVSLSNKK